jgi:hypothetical protein
MKPLESLQFHCGELVNMQIDPNSGQLSAIPKPSTALVSGPDAERFSS